MLAGQSPRTVRWMPQTPLMSFKSVGHETAKAEQMKAKSATKSIKNFICRVKSATEILRRSTLERITREITLINWLEEEQSLKVFFVELVAGTSVSV